MHWRCLVTSADNLKNDSWRIKDTLSNVATYSPGQGAAPFGRKDASGRTARELASMFVEWFPEMAARGTGYDRDYADRFAGIMAAVEIGRLPIFSADFEIDLSADSVPPPPGDIH